MINLSTTKFDEELFEIFEEIYEILISSYDPEKGYYVKAIDDSMLGNSEAYEKGRIYSSLEFENSRIETFFESEDWKENIRIIEEWLSQQYGTMLETFIVPDLPSLQPDQLYKLLVSPEFEAGISPFSVRVKYEFKWTDYSLLEQRRLWIQYIFHNQDKILNEEALKLIRLGRKRTEEGYNDELGIIPEQYSMYYHDSFKPNPNHLAKLLTKLEFELVYVERFLHLYPSIKEVLNSFRSNFLNMPGNTFFTKEIFQDRITINAKSFLGYSAGFFIFKGFISPDHYFDYDVRPFLEFSYSGPTYSLVPVLVQLIEAKLNVFENYFQYIEDRLFRSLGLNISKESKSKLQVIKYLKRFYKDIERTDFMNRILLNGITYPEKVYKLFNICLIKILDKMEANYDGSYLDHLLLPSELMAKGIGFNYNVEKEYIENGLDRPFFESSSIHWKGGYWISLLEEIFKPFYTNKNKEGNPFMQKEHVFGILRRNFSCYGEEFNPKRFPFDGEKQTLRHFIYKVFKYIEGLPIPKISKRRLTQFLFQNFEVFANDLMEENQEKDFENQISYLKNYSGSPSSILDINEIELETLKRKLT